jgi:ligand-binding SRPBCC domain-containing protein
MPFVADASSVFQWDKGVLVADKTYILSFQQQVSRSLEEVFDFFSRAENLQALTPPWLNFKIRGVKPLPVQQGTLIHYSLRVHGIPLRWTSEIVEWDPPHRFVDLQLRGPYKVWRHEHRFESHDGGTLILTRSISLFRSDLWDGLRTRSRCNRTCRKFLLFAKNKSMHFLAEHAETTQSLLSTSKDAYRIVLQPSSQ